jgi:hypothetical protein
MHLGVAPVDQLAIEPDPSVAIVKCLRGHCAFLSFEAVGLVFARLELHGSGRFSPVG